MGSSPESEYAKFLKKVERTIYVDNLSPEVTDAVMKAAFNQFGTVVSVQFISQYVVPNRMPRAALVEMAEGDNVRGIIDNMATLPFMILGMPRPVRARAAKPEMFEERPRKPGQRIFCEWLDPKDPDFEVANEIKELVIKQALEERYLLKKQLDEEEELHKQQAETLKSHSKKLELIDKVIEDDTAKKLGRHYQFNLTNPGAKNVRDS